MDAYHLTLGFLKERDFILFVSHLSSPLRGREMSNDRKLTQPEIKGCVCLRDNVSNFVEEMMSRIQYGQVEKCVPGLFG